MTRFTIKEIGEKLTIAGRLKAKPLCIYGSEEIPEGGKPITTYDRCLARVMYAASVKDDLPPVYFGSGALTGCCPGGIGWTGYGKLIPMIDYFVSYGIKEYRNGEAEYLKASPEVVRKSKEAIGALTPPGKYTVIRPCKDLGSDPGVRAFVCYGNSEQIRNLCSLIHFRSTDPINPVRAAWGPTCSAWISYPAGMAEKAPVDSAYLGPVDPTSNSWFPEHCLGLGIPYKIAVGMCEDLESSFVMKRPHVAYPEVREDPLVRLEK